MRRVLHVVEALDRGAVENWLVRMLEHARRRGIEVDWSFYCILDRPGVLDEKARSLGAQIVASPVPIKGKVAFVHALRSELRRGRYEVLHCHHDLVSGLYLLASAGLPISRRLVHVHNADENVPTPSRLKQRLYREPLRQMCLALADRVVGISNGTLDTFLDGRPRRPGRDLVHYYGVDSARFEASEADRAGFRHRIGVAQDALLLLFGGRIVPEKNPLFAVDVLAKLRRSESRAIGIFAGAGSLEQAVRAHAIELGIEDAVFLLGWRQDLPDTMRCCDWFILPRP
jgi:glycosyltransferase involved in cell wall biosynthesis